MSGYYEAYPSDRDTPWFYAEMEPEDPENIPDLLLPEPPYIELPDPVSQAWDPEKEECKF